MKIRGLMHGIFEYTEIYGTTIGICKYSPNQKHKIYDLIEGIFEYISCNHQTHKCDHPSSVSFYSVSCQIGYFDWFLLNSDGLEYIYLKKVISMVSKMLLFFSVYQRSILTILETH